MAMLRIAGCHSAGVLAADAKIIPITVLYVTPLLDISAPESLLWFYLLLLLQYKSIVDAKKAKGLDASIQFYPNQKHGFAMRSGTEPNVTAAAATAFQKGAAFLKYQFTK